ncbi:hypothetical protein [Paenibacillus pedocola]|uniref:hypothetical protein n=1 Tax=Paenibacillus pedocola TaxID=3242193 RepID=UPI0028778964|nr:hypothetical protein [Paenibacillus typhae]
MLDDTARKLLRIMCHFRSHFGRMPQLKELARLSGRREAQVMSGLRELALQGFIQWQPPQPVEAAVILIAWESPEPGAKVTGTGSGHWTD